MNSPQLVPIKILTNEWMERMDLLIIFVNEVFFPKRKSSNVWSRDDRFPGDIPANKLHNIDGDDFDC